MAKHDLYRLVSEDALPALPKCMSMRCTLIMRHVHAHDHDRVTNVGLSDRCMRRRGTTLAVMREYTSFQSFT